MPYEWVSDALGGGILGLFGILIVVLSLVIYRDQRGQIRELKEDNKDLRNALARLTDVVEQWTPEQQRKRLKRP